MVPVYYSRTKFSLENLSIIYRGIESIGLFMATCSETGWSIEQILLLPDHQRNGVGEEVIRAFLSEAKQVDVPVSLNVLRDSPALRLYERLGFKIVSKTELEVRMIFCV